MLTGGDRVPGSIDLLGACPTTVALADVRILKQGERINSNL